MSGGSLPPAGWYADPRDSRLVRYWDGQVWTAHTAPSPSLTEEIAVPEQPQRARGGFFGSKKELEQEVAELRKLVDGFGYAEREALGSQVTGLERARIALSAEIETMRNTIQELETQVVTTREELVLQEVGVYDYHHKLEDAEAYRPRLEQIRIRIRQMSRTDGGAVQASTAWTVEGSASKGRKMVSEVSKLLLRAYNGEADVLVNRMRPYKLSAAVERLNKSREIISRLGTTMNISITEPYHDLRIEELKLTADFLAKKEEVKEEERVERERLRDELKARKEFEVEKLRLAKEQAHYLAALERLRATGATEEAEAVQSKLAEISDAIHGVEAREANIRAGYVYVISNIGSFGEGVVKIGLTRRLEPMDRIRELGDASVPFRYDLHALVFSDDAVSLEGYLHGALADRRMNLVNLRREFFYASPSEVHDVLKAANCSILEFFESPEADEWHQSVNTRRRAELHPN